ncbi:phosphotransferase [Fictibacillus iocasae]|uniref:Phosphotransferase n=1 Tax=Fictibacillus iocasae TaxID=2715437 RepID=A0ABW2NP05_9BACL
MNKQYTDDNSWDRLFFKELPKNGVNVKNYWFYRENVVKVLSEKNDTFILKAFDSKFECKVQLELSKWFKQFEKPAIGPIGAFPSKKRYLKWNEYYWVIMPFYEGRDLHYGNLDDVRYAAEAITRFHDQASVPQELYHKISEYKLYDKWKRRLSKFKSLAQSETWPKEIVPLLPEMIFWGEWALDEYNHKQIDALFEKEKQNEQLCHGDVAPHNFLLPRNGEAMLIDYDLITAAPGMIDWLQFTNRILPFWKWRYDKIAPALPEACLQLFRKRWFLQLLVFPTDLYREWNRAFSSESHSSIEQVSRFTQTDFQYRKPFIKRIINHLEQKRIG